MEASYTAQVHLEGQVHRVTGGPATPLLDALLAAGVGVPYSCREGACVALAGGHVPACHAMPHGERVEVTYG